MITTTLAELRRALAVAGLAQPNQPAVPVLAGLLVEAVSGRVTVTSFDYSTAVTVHLDATATRDVRCVIPYRFLARLLPPTGVPKLVRRVPKPERDRLPVTLDADPASATLAVNGHEIAVETLPVNDYPELPAPASPTATVDRDTLADRIARIMPAVGDGNNLEIFQAIQVRAGDTGVRLTATDRYRIAHATMGVPVAGEAWAVAVRGRLLERLVKHLPDGSVGLGVAARPLGSMVTVTSGRVTVTTRAQDDLPSVPKLVEPTATLTVNREALADAVEVAELIAEARGGRMVAARVETREGAVRVAPNMSAPGGRRTVIPELVAKTTGVHGDGLTVGFNPGFLLDALRSVGGETVELRFRGATKAVTVTGGTPGVEYLVMPIRMA